MSIIRRGDIKGVIFQYRPGPLKVDRKPAPRDHFIRFGALPGYRGSRGIGVSQPDRHRKRPLHGLVLPASVNVVSKVGIKEKPMAKNPRREFIKAGLTGI